MALHFARLGYPRWKCALLLFHPANFYIHTALAAREGSDRYGLI